MDLSYLFDEEEEEEEKKKEIKSHVIISFAFHF